MAADQRCVSPAYLYGLLMSQDNDIQVREEGFYYLQFAADFSHLRAAVTLNILLRREHGYNCQSQFEIAITLARQPNSARYASQGHVEAKYRYALMLRDGIGVNRDIERCIEYLQSAVDFNYEEDKEELGKTFYDYPDVAMGVALSLRIIADRGDPRGLYVYEQTLLNGWGIERDVAAGIDYLRPAADCGHLNAELERSNLFIRRGDSATADFHLKSAPKQGPSRICAVYNLMQLVLQDWEIIDQCLEFPRPYEKDILSMIESCNPADSEQLWGLLCLSLVLNP
jgi:TPR repeat protein